MGSENAADDPGGRCYNRYNDHKFFSMKKPAISVIMPVYNAEKYVGASIQSVLDQRFSDFELIIINDGCTDQSAAVISSFEDQRIVYHEQPNQGQVIASNNGIKLARGRYIKFFDADDILDPAHLDLQYKVLNGSTVHLAACQWAVFYEDYHTASFKPEYTNRDYDEPLDWFYDAHHYDVGMLGAWRWLIPRPLLDKAGYWHPDLSLNNDFDFSVRLLCASQGVRYAKGAKLYYRTGNQGALTHSRTRNAYQSALLTTELAMDQILGLENSARMRRLFANRFQTWIYQIYPEHPDIRRTMHSHIKRLGGSTVKPEGGRLFRFLNQFLPWEIVRWVQFLMHKTIWRPILKWKYSKKLEQYSGNV